MSLDTLFRLPSPEWAGTLVSLALAIVSAAAALYSSVAVPWAAAPEAATAATFDEYGKPRTRVSADGYHAFQHLSEVRQRDPAKGLGRVTWLVAGPMTALGVVGGLQVPNVGWLYTVGPILVAAIVDWIAVLALGRTARKAADARIRAMMS